LLSRIRQHVESEHKLGKYVSPDTKRVLKEYLGNFQEVSKVFPHKRVSKFLELLQVFVIYNLHLLSKLFACENADFYKHEFLKINSPIKQQLHAELKFFTFI